MSDAGPQSELEDCVRANLSWAMQLAVRLAGSVHDAEDIVQDSLVRVTKSVDSFRGASSFRTWFARIIVNVFRTRSAANRVQTATLADDQAASGLSPAEQLSLEESRRQVRQCVLALPARQREVLVLSVYERLSAEEIAEVLNISIQNVYSSLHVARNRLRRELLSHFLESETP